MGSGKDETADAANARSGLPPESDGLESRPTEQLSRDAVTADAEPAADPDTQETEQLSRRDLADSTRNGPGDAGFGPPLTEFGPPVAGFGPPTADPVSARGATDPGAGQVGGASDDSGPPHADAGSPRNDVGSPHPDSGPPQSDFGPPLSDFGPPQSDFGPPQSDFGPPQSDFGPPLSDFGPPLSDFGKAPDAGAAAWTPAAPPSPSPEIGWRPVDAPDYRAPESAPAPPTARFDPTPAPDTTVRLSSDQVPPAPKKSSGWAAAGGINTSNSGRESSWLRGGETGYPPATPEPARSSTSAAKSTGPERESLSWADDPIGKMLAPKAAPPPPPEPESRGRGRLLLVAGAVVVLIAVVVTVALITRGGPEDDVSADPAPATTGAAVTSSAALSCPARKDGRVTVGNGAGSTASGAEAILGFQHAFYAQRSGTKAREFVAPDALNISPADTIQQAIDEVIPMGTTYCLRIVEITPDIFDADLTEHRPDGTTTVYRQHITTVDRDGRHLIVAINERP
ncbi:MULTISPECIES: hypothetical protein [unclassified Nocardia]|uniref:hypothetical protein n=1 Tax=unclassified Nocardia TaxID=2637762 RepID=UPI00278C3378|nr:MULTISPECIES: hypothetical protein [unclassified Nocardia]